jgi:hypothetical protein
MPAIDVNDRRKLKSAASGCPPTAYVHTISRENRLSGVKTEVVGHRHADSVLISKARFVEGKNTLEITSR